MDPSHLLLPGWPHLSSIDFTRWQKPRRIRGKAKGFPPLGRPFSELSHSISTNGKGKRSSETRTPQWMMHSTHSCSLTILIYCLLHLFTIFLPSFYYPCTGTICLPSFLPSVYHLLPIVFLEFLLHHWFSPNEVSSLTSQAAQICASRSAQHRAATLDHSYSVSLHWDIANQTGD